MDVEEQIAAYKKAKKSAYCKKYYEEHKEQILARQKRYSKTHKEEHRIYMRNYRELHKKERGD